MKPGLPTYLVLLRQLIEPGEAVRYSWWLSVALFIVVASFSYNYVFGYCYGFGRSCLLTSGSDVFASFSSVDYFPAEFTALDAEYVQRAKQAFAVSLSVVIVFTLALTLTLFAVFLQHRDQYRSPLVIEHGPANWMVHGPLLFFLAMVVSTYTVTQSGCAFYKDCDGYNYYVGEVFFFMALAIISVVPPLFNSLLKFLCAGFSMSHKNRSDL
jgi:hypothetical protein